jgi:urease accessory protein UreH
MPKFERPQMNGRLVLACTYAAGRSRLTTMRFEGLARSSRALPESGGAVRVLTANLGPGFLSGDCVTRDVDVAAGATLIVGAQMATPVFAGEATSRSHTRASVAASGALYVPGEPLLIAAGAEHESSTDVAIQGDGLALVAEIAVLGAGARLRAHTTASIDGRLVARDACELRGGGDERPLLTAIVVSADAARRETLAARYAAAVAEHPSIRAGIGGTGGALVIRARADGAWALTQFLEHVVALTRAIPALHTRGRAAAPGSVRATRALVASGSRSILRPDRPKNTSREIPTS